MNIELILNNNLKCFNNEKNINFGNIIRLSQKNIFEKSDLVEIVNNRQYI